MSCPKRNSAVGAAAQAASLRPMQTPLLLQHLQAAGPQCPGHGQLHQEEVWQRPVQQLLQAPGAAHAARHLEPGGLQRGADDLLVDVVIVDGHDHYLAGLLQQPGRAVSCGQNEVLCQERAVGRSSGRLTLDLLGIDASGAGSVRPRSVAPVRDGQAEARVADVGRR